MSSDLRAEIDTVLEENSPTNRHSLYQLKYFVVCKEPTHQSRLWRCLQELQDRRDAAEAIDLEMEDLKDTDLLLGIKVAKLSQECSATGLDKDEIEIQLRQLGRKRKDVEKQLSRLTQRSKDNQEEARFFLEAFNALSNKEPLKPYDDIAVQEEYWNEKLTQEVRLKVLFQRPLGDELVRTVLALRDQAPIKQELISVINGIQDTAIQEKLGQVQAKLDSTELDDLMDKKKKE